VNQVVVLIEGFASGVELFARCAVDGVLEGERVPERGLDGFRKEQAEIAVGGRDDAFAQFDRDILGDGFLADVDDLGTEGDEGFAVGSEVAEKFHEDAAFGVVGINGALLLFVPQGAEFAEFLLVIAIGGACGTDSLEFIGDGSGKLLL